MLHTLIKQRIANYLLVLVLTALYEPLALPAACRHQCCVAYHQGALNILLDHEQLHRLKDMLLQDKHDIEYDDGEKESVVMHQEKWVWCRPLPARVPKQATAKQRAGHPGTAQQPMHPRAQPKCALQEQTASDNTAKQLSSAQQHAPTKDQPQLGPCPASPEPHLDSGSAQPQLQSQAQAQQPTGRLPLGELPELSPGPAAAAKGTQPSPTPVQCGAALPATTTGLTESKELHSNLILPDSASTSQSHQNSKAATSPAATRSGEQLGTSAGKNEAAGPPLPAAQESMQPVGSEDNHAHTDAANQPGGTENAGNKQSRVTAHVEQLKLESLRAVSLPASLQAKTPPVNAPAIDQPGTGSPQTKPCIRDNTTAEPHLSSPVQSGLPAPHPSQQADAAVAHDPAAAAAKPVKSSAVAAVAKKKRGRPAKKGRQQAAGHRHSKRRAAASPEPAAEVSEQQVAEVCFNRLTNAERKPAAKASKEQADPKQPAVVYRRGKRKAEVALKPTAELSEQHADEDHDRQQQHSGHGKEQLNIARQMPVHEQRKSDDHQLPMRKQKRRPVLSSVHTVALPEPDASAEEVKQPPKQAIADPQTQPDPQRRPEQHEQQAQHEHSAQHEQQAQHEHSAQHEQQAQHEHSAQHAQQAQHRQQPQPGHQAQHGPPGHAPRQSLVQPVADPPSEPAQSQQALPPRVSPLTASGKADAASAPVATAPSHRNADVQAAEPAACAVAKSSENGSIQQAGRSMSLVSSGLEKAKVDQMKRVCRRLRADTCSGVNDHTTHVVFKVRFLACKAALMLLIALGTCAVFFLF